MARELGWPDAPEALPRPVIDSHTHLDVHDRSLHGDQAPDADALLAWAEQVAASETNWICLPPGRLPKTLKCRRATSGSGTTMPWILRLPCDETMPTSFT